VAVRRPASARTSWLSLALLLCVAARAADLPYTLAIAPTGDAPLPALTRTGARRSSAWRTTSASFPRSAFE